MHQIEHLKHKAIRGEAIGNGDIIIAVSDVYDEQQKTSETVLEHGKQINILHANYDGMNQALGALTTSKIAAAAKHQGLMVVPRLGWKLISVIGGGPILALMLFLWHTFSNEYAIKQAVDLHTAEIADFKNTSVENQNVIIADQKALLQVLGQQGAAQKVEDAAAQAERNKNNGIH